MTNRVDVLQPPVRALDAVIVDVFSLVLKRLLDIFAYRLAILRVDSLAPHLACGRTLPRVEFKNAEHLLRPIMPTLEFYFTDRIPSPTTRTGLPLCIQHFRFANSLP